MRRLICYVLFALIISGCTSQSAHNTITMDSVQETFEFNIVDESTALIKTKNFISDVIKSNESVEFDIYYKPVLGSFLEQITLAMNKLGVNKKSITPIAIEGDNEKDIVVIAKYTVIREKDCGAINIFNKDEYNVGCSLEYNRNLSFVNPLASVE
ncbi:hypothetical protein [uncultured Photobacterium sp.]|uniref:hypothetical protein n=1 Tax=uncultured Photobacterium sp. TaxID=173973 RepID=UPI0026367C05|nr:hypothetical protein [uncultured Photobacterium sp.]